MTDEEIDAVIEKILTEKLKPLYMSKDINTRCADTGNTALIFAAASGDALLVKRLLERGANPTLRNLEGDNAFKAAIYHRDKGLVKALLPHETKQSLNEENCNGNTALAIAACDAWIWGERVIMDAGGIIPGMHLKEDITPSQMRAEFLKLLQQNGSVLREGGFASRRILANIFVEKGKADFPIGYLDYAFLNSDLRCLMTLADWACNTYKSKIFIFNSMHNDALRFAPDTVGFYHRYTNDVFCFYNDILSLDTVSTFFHESMHLVMNDIYRNSSRPYAREDSGKEERFNMILGETVTRLYNMKSNLMLDATREAYDILCSVYTYPPYKRASELIARIPQILVRMGADKGKEWLSQFKELMEYYNTIVIPDMENYIVKKDYSSIGFLQRGRYADRCIPPSSFDRIMQRIYDRKEGDFILIGLKEAHEEITLDQLTQIKKMALFFKYESIVIAKWEEDLEEHRRYEMLEREQKKEQERKRTRLDEIYEQERKRTRLDEIYEQERKRIHLDQWSQYSKNIKILDALHLDPYNEEYLRYWSSQVTGFGGCYYKGHRIPHTIANIFEMLRKKSLIDISPDKLLEEINRIRGQDSGSLISALGIFSMRGAAVKNLRESPDEAFLLSFSPGNGCQGM